MLHDFSASLYPDWSGPTVEIPAWAVRYGLSKNRVLIQRIYASAELWRQAEMDELPNIAPVIVLFNKPPAEIKAMVGGEIWKAIHHAKLKANVDRLVFCMLGGWTIHEAMQFPAAEKRRAKTLLSHSKSAVILASRLATRGGDFTSLLIMAEDIQRMGGRFELEWGRKRLKREHEALVMKRIIDRTDPNPWSKPWFCDVGRYSFSLLKSEAELIIEGAVQRHCVSSYARACRDGREIVLRIEGDERATCSWRVGESHIQVQGFANTPVSAECVRAARAARAAFQRRDREGG